MDVWDARYSRKYVARATQQQTRVIFKKQEERPNEWLRGQEDFPGLRDRGCYYCGWTGQECFYVAERVELLWWGPMDRVTRSIFKPWNLMEFAMVGFRLDWYLWFFSPSNFFFFLRIGLSVLCLAQHSILEIGNIFVCVLDIHRWRGILTSDEPYPASHSELILML